MDQTNSPAISVIIPAFNAGRFIKRTLDSVFAQTHGDFEVIVVDDGSIDNTAEIIKNYGRPIHYIYQKNAGDGPARNTGINAAKGQWLAFLDHDDEWLPEKLRLQMQLLKENSDLKWCATSFYTKIGETRRIAAGFDRLHNVLNGRAYFENYFAAISKKQAGFLTSTLIIRKDIFEKTGLFESCWLRCADTDMWWRIAYLHPRIGFVAEPLTILHLDVQDEVGTRLRLKARHGQDDRKLIAKHLKLAHEHNCSNVFVPAAKLILLQTLLIALSYGFKQDARAIASQFRSLLGTHWLILTYIFTIFPELTAFCAETLIKLRRILGLQKDLSRRQITQTDSEKAGLNLPGLRTHFMKEDFSVQVPRDQYYSAYDHLPRFICYFHQIELVKSLSPKTVLEIGIGNKTVSNYLRQHGYLLTTVDFDRRLEPDYVADVRALPFEDNSFDVVLASEIIEHLPWPDVDKALSELHRVSKKHIIISVPYCSTCAEITVRLPTPLQKLFGRMYLDLLIALPHFFKTYKFNGEHYWELGTQKAVHSENSEIYLKPVSK